MKLEEGEVLCPECYGKGSIPTKKVRGEIVTDCLCRKCYGTGKLDWVEVCMGKSIGKVLYNSITLPLIRHIYPKLIAKELVSIQPINEVKNET